MTSVQERLQIKREPLDKWSAREQLSLASAVARSGDQNWMSVSRSLKPFGDANRPSDWFHQKNCAAQYGVLLENVETPKRKKRTSGSESALETPAESILHKLTSERLAELKKLMAEERTEYVKLQEDMALLQKGNISEEQLDQWCKEIDEEEHQKEQEIITHSKWLKERELRKQEIERVWRPAIKVNAPSTSQKRKASESIEGFTDVETTEEVIAIPTTDPGKSALSPLLTSLLKSPAHAQNVVTSSILHTAITSQRPTTTNPTIASLLNSSTNVTVSPGLQQLVSSAIGQDTTTTHRADSEVASPELPDDAADILPNLKVEDILASDEPLPEIKNEEVEVIISDLIENAEIVTNPEEHLQLDGNVDLMDNLENELEELVNEENAAKDAAALQEIKQEKNEHGKDIPSVDPFEFQEDPEFYEQPLVKQSPNVVKQEVVITEEDVTEDVEPPPPAPLPPPPPPPPPPAPIKLEVKSDEPKIEKHELQGGSVEIVEVVVMEDEEIDKELNKSQIEDIVHSNKIELPTSSINEIIPKVEPKEEAIEEEQINEKDSICEESNTESIDMEIKSEPDVTKDENVIIEAEASTSRTNIFTPEFGEELYDDSLNMEVKIDKSGKAKRDYSRTKKKEEKDIELLFEVEQPQLEEELTETNSEKEFQEIEKKSESKLKIKSENEGSNSPWMEEEDISNTSKTRRRYSTPGTPVDSVPNSPLSGIAFDDDRDYRNWKKSVMLVYNRLTTHKFSSIFLKPITNDQAPGYHNIVYRPMDLQTIRKNIENGNIRTTIEFHRDVLLMFNNAIIYNKTNEHIYNMARQMQQESVQQIQILFQAQTDAPARRETRTSEPGSKRKRGIEESTKNKKKKED